MKLTPQFCGGLLALALAAGAFGQPQPGTVLWTYQAGNPISSSPALASDGTVYLAAGLLTAVTNSGSMASNKWNFPAGGESPAVAVDGTIYVAEGRGLYAVTPLGVQKWFFAAVGAAGSVAIGLDGMVYFAAEGRIYAISPSGQKKWDYPLDMDPVSSWSDLQSPVIGEDGTIYVGLERFLYALSPYGTNKWSANLSFFSAQSPAIGVNGTIRGTVTVGGLYSIDSGGTNLWYAPAGAVNGSPVMGTAGTIYAAGGSRSLYAVGPGGQLSWHALDTYPQYGSFTVPAVDAGGRIYYCVSNSVWALNPQGQVQWSITTPNVPDPRVDVATTSPIIGPDGTLYATLGTTLYAITTGTNGPANSPWPMYRQNARHTGKVEKPALKGPKKRADANFEFQLYAQLGQTNTVESTTNLSVWTSLTNVVVTNVPMDVVDLTASNAPARLYRTISQ